MDDGDRAPGHRRGVRVRGPHADIDERRDDRRHHARPRPPGDDDRHAARQPEHFVVRGVHVRLRRGRDDLRVPLWLGHTETYVHRVPGRPVSPTPDSRTASTRSACARSTARATSTTSAAEFTFTVNTGAPLPLSIAAPVADTYTKAASSEFAGAAQPGAEVEPSSSAPNPSVRPSPTRRAAGRTSVVLPAVDGALHVPGRVSRARRRSTVRLLVDRTQPAPAVAAPATEPEAATLTFGAAAEPTASFACRLEGPGRGAEFAPCSSPQRYGGLAAGAYRFTVRATDAAGNTADSPPQEFTIAGAPPVVVPESSAPIPTPTPRPTETPAPQPDVGESVVIRPTAARCSIQAARHRTSSSSSSRSAEIPLGATIDTKNGRIQLRFEPEDGKVQTATFYGGIFLVTPGGQDPRPQAHRAAGRLPEEGQGRRRADQEGEDAQAVGRRQGHVPHHGQVQRRHRARHEVARGGLLRRHAHARRQSASWRFATRERRPCSSAPGSSTWPSRANACPFGRCPAPDVAVRVGRWAGVQRSSHWVAALLCAAPASGGDVERHRTGDPGGIVHRRRTLPERCAPRSPRLRRRRTARTRSTSRRA